MSIEQAAPVREAAQARETTLVAGNERLPRDVVNRMAETVANCEFSLDQAYVATAEFAMLMPSIRSQTRIPFGSAGAAVTRATDALNLLAQAREAIRESHAHLDHLAKRAGVDPSMDNPFQWKWGRG